MGFAVPIHMVRDIANHFVESGNAWRAKFGIRYDDRTTAPISDMAGLVKVPIPCSLRDALRFEL